MLDEVIQRVEIEVGEDLAGQVPDRKAAPGRRVEKALLSRQAVPVIAVPADSAVVRRVAEYHGPAQVNEEFAILAMVPRPQERSEPVEQELSVDAHEEALDVELQNVGIAGVVVRTAPDEPVDPLYSQVASLADPARVAIEDELVLEEVVDLVDDEVMNDAVAELGGEDLAFHRLVDDESERGAGCVGPCIDLFAQAQEVLLVVNLERGRVRCTSLVPAATLVGREDLLDRYRRMREELYLHPIGT